MELDPIAVALKFGFLAVLYLFLLWVARSALKDLRGESQDVYLGPSADFEDATGMYTASAPPLRPGVRPYSSRPPPAYPEGPAQTTSGRFNPQNGAAVHPGTSAAGPVGIG